VGKSDLPYEEWYVWDLELIRNTDIILVKKFERRGKLDEADVDGGKY
jgi:hypothetical protein